MLIIIQYRIRAHHLLYNNDFIEQLQDISNHTRVVLIDLSKVSHSQALSFESHLDVFERGRFKKIANKEKRHSFVVCRFVTKLLISEFFHVDPSTLHFQYTERGKPYMTTPGIEFNISHSGNFALIGVSHHQIGVDIEKINPNRNFKMLAETVLSEGERRWVFVDGNQVNPHEEVIQRFYQLWTLKEARLKCDGDGLAGHYPAATFSPETSWGYPGYTVFTRALESYIYTICIHTKD